MDVELSYDLPEVVCPESSIYTYPSRIADAWSPQIEKVVAQACTLVTSKLVMRMFLGSTATLDLHWTSNPFRRVQRQRPPLDLGDKAILDCRFDTSWNYSHVIVNMAQYALLARQLLAQRTSHCPEVTAIFARKCSPFAVEIMKLLGFPVLITDREVRGEVISITKIGDSNRYFVFMPELLTEVPGSSDASYERIFISRKSTRTLKNAGEVNQFLESRGYHICYFEDMPVRSQWSIMKNVKEIVCIHGAGMINLLFNQLWLRGRGPRVVEIFPGGFSVVYFRYLVSRMAGQWCAVRGQVSPEIVRDLDVKNKPLSHEAEPFRVHLDSLAAALDSFHE